jgi:predicted PurR-regulated permease PerM
MTFVLVIGIVAIFGTFIGSVVADQASNLAKEAPVFLDRIRQNPAPGPEGVRSLKSQISGAIEGQLRQHYGDIASAVPRVSLRVLSASRNLIYIIIVPILSFLILRDGRSIRDGFIELLESGQEAARETLADVHTLLLQYMRALLFLCCATFVSFSIVLSLMGVPYSIFLAAIAFPLEFVPLVGPLSAAVIIIAVSAVAGYTHLLWLLAFLAIYRMFQDYVLSPHLMSKGVELHPLLIIFGVFAGGDIGGVAGIFLSVPVLALVRLLYHHLRKVQTARRLQSIA